MTSHENHKQAWSIVQISDVADVIRGITFPSEAKKFSHAEQRIACLRTANVQREIDWENLWFVDEEYLKRDEQVLRINDILMSIANSIEHLGKAAIVKYIPFNATLGTFIINVRALKCVLPKWLYYYFSTAEFKKTVQMNASTTTNISNISTRKLEALCLPLAPINEQMRIIAVIEELFSDLDNGIENIVIAQKQLQLYRLAVLEHAYKGAISNRRSNAIDVKPFYVKMEQLCVVSGGITKNARNAAKGIPCPYLRVANVYSNKFILNDIATICISSSEREKTLLQKGDLLFFEGNGSLEQIGRVAMWEGQINDCVHQNHLIKVRPKVNVVGKYIMYYFMSQEGRDQIKAQASSTAGLFTLSISKIKQLKVPYRSEAEQLRIVQEIEARLSLCDRMDQAIEESLKKAEVLRQCILKKAFEGRLVPQDPNDEPAEKLVERIRLEREAQKPVAKTTGRGRGRKHE